MRHFMVGIDICKKCLSNPEIPSDKNALNGMLWLSFYQHLLCSVCLRICSGELAWRHLVGYIIRLVKAEVKAEVKADQPFLPPDQLTYEYELLPLFCRGSSYIWREQQCAAVVFASSAQTNNSIDYTNCWTQSQSICFAFALLYSLTLWDSIVVCNIIQVETWHTTMMHHQTPFFVNIDKSLSATLLMVWQ